VTTCSTVTRTEEQPGSCWPISGPRFKEEAGGVRGAGLVSRCMRTAAARREGSWWRTSVGWGSLYLWVIRQHEEHVRKADSTCYIQAVSHPSTDQARPCLAYEIRRDRACSRHMTREHLTPLWQYLFKYTNNKTFLTMRNKCYQLKCNISYEIKYLVTNNIENHNHPKP